MLTQGLDRHGVQRHQALACRRFRTQLPRRLVLHDAEGPRDPHLRGQQINVSPSQASDLAAAPPSRGEQQPHRIQPIFSNLGEEHAQLRRRPDVMRRLRRRRLLNRIGDIAGRLAELDRVTERLVDDAVNVGDGLGDNQHRSDRRTARARRRAG
jgi:hypothetical protein